MSGGGLLLGLVIAAFVAIWIWIALVSLFDAVCDAGDRFFAALFSPVHTFFDSMREKKIERQEKEIERRTNELIERNQDIIGDHLARINALSLPEDPCVAAQDCMREIVTKRTGISKWILKLSIIGRHGFSIHALPDEWHALKDHIVDSIHRKSQAVRQEQERHERQQPCDHPRSQGYARLYRNTGYRDHDIPSR